MHVDPIGFRFLLLSATSRNDSLSVSLTLVLLPVFDLIVRQYFDRVLGINVASSTPDRRGGDDAPDGDTRSASYSPKIPSWTGR